MSGTGASRKKPALCHADHTALSCNAQPYARAVCPPLRHPLPGHTTNPTIQSLAISADPHAQPKCTAHRHSLLTSFSACGRTWYPQNARKKKPANHSIYPDEYVPLKQSYKARQAVNSMQADTSHAKNPVRSTSPP
jgi:hypothetical protein